MVEFWAALINRPPIPGILVVVTPIRSLLLQYQFTVLLHYKNE